MLGSSKTWVFGSPRRSLIRLLTSDQVGRLHTSFFQQLTVLRYEVGDPTGRVFSIPFPPGQEGFPQRVCPLAAVPVAHRPCRARNDWIRVRPKRGFARQLGAV